ncbi:ribosome biogenesis protein SLX9-domain-containing protein [Gautieria morchelliformis]|nr:ribosome biogenesis protein SLX9-domain-containing protein [Gautieria morchelliformis]
MPADRTQRVVRHAQTTRRESRPFSVQQLAVSSQIASQASGNDFLATSPPQEHQLTKKDKQQLRHDAFMRRLGPTSMPYSKSHMKRLKRKAKGKLSTDLKSMGEAIAAVEAQDDPSHSLAQADQMVHGPRDPNILPPKQPRGQIGESKHGSLTINQRKRALQLENLRHKLVLADSDFSSNPFQTIRTHAQNTLVKQKTSHKLG